MNRSAVTLAVAVLLGPGRGDAQTLTLGEAIRRAEHSAYPVRIAEGDAAAGAGQAVRALQGVLPTVRFEGSYLRTTDPLNAFGFALRQRTVSAASFDPAALNYPRAIGDLATGLVAELPIFNADAWLGRKAAQDARASADATLGWSRQSAAVDATRAYFGALLAAERVGTLETGLAAANAHLRQAESLLRNGAVTRSDVLIAEVKAGEIEAMLIGARSDATLARERLAVAIGTPDDTSWTLPPALPEADAVRRLGEGIAADRANASGRADLRAADYASGAARADLQRARSLYLPRINSFGRVDWNAASTAFGGSDSWTVGVMVSWTPFAGGAQLGETRAAQGRSTAAAAAAEAAAAAARLELRQADAALQVSLARLGIAARSVDQSAEAHRIVTRKYDGGLATVVELFDAAAIDTQARLAFADARYQVITAAAGRLRALGLDLAPIASLDR